MNINNNIEENNNQQIQEDKFEENKTDINNTNNSNIIIEHSNQISSKKINPDNIDNLDISCDDFLEKSLINEIKQTIKQLEHNCESQVGEAAVEARCRILSYAIILVDVYKKPISNLIYPHAKLGEAYYDIKYYEQAKEHFENALKYNADATNEKYQTLPEDYYLRLSIKLSRCFLETKLYDTALKLANSCLNKNKSFFGENDISNLEIYDIIYQAYNFELIEY